ncbi:MAG TPA: apolipoprotein N-acyltransferase [Candidatus Polarisedimenticolia bacterium]|jgi:apolipoprotein N-acyltransferase|nr:apolipoprotein N-acyltransferase [Candidatus Polarisedimenticolia bacterium]
MRDSPAAIGKAPHAGFRGTLWACASGAVLALAYPLADRGILALVALIPFLLSLQATEKGTALLRGYACGGSFFAILLYWIPAVMETYGGLPLPVAWLLQALLVFYLATFFALFAWIVSVAWRRYGPVALAFAPVSWVALEIARARLLTGFPWGLLGYTQYRNPALLQAAVWGGIFAVSFLVMAVNAGGALLILQPAASRARIAGAILIAVSALSFMGGRLALGREAGHEADGDGGAIPVAAIQANVAQDHKWDPKAAAGTLSDLARLSRQAASSGARLIVWPESSSPFSVRRPGGDRASGPGVETDAAYAAFLGDLARSLHADLIVGSVDYRAAGETVRAYNSALAVGADGTLGATYDKVHLVPFGEYVPLARALFFVNRMVSGSIGEFDAGTRLEPLPTSVGRAGTVICYEAIFPEIVRRVAGRDAAFLVNITNDAWFGRTAAPYQHLAMAAVRAAENRRYMVRAANTGISALIDPFGRILARTGIEESAVLGGTIRARHDRTVYARCGDLFAWGCAILTALQVAALRAAFLRSGIGSP